MAPAMKAQEFEFYNVNINLSNLLRINEILYFKSQKLKFREPKADRKALCCRTHGAICLEDHNVAADLNSQ